MESGGKRAFKRPDFQEVSKPQNKGVPKFFGGFVVVVVAVVVVVVAAAAAAVVVVVVFFFWMGVEWSERVS